MSRAFAFEQVNVQLPVQSEPELHAQWRGRRFMLGRCRSAQEDRAIAGLSADLQATNLLLAGLG